MLANRRARAPASAVGKKWPGKVVICTCQSLRGNTQGVSLVSVTRFAGCRQCRCSSRSSCGPDTAWISGTQVLLTLLLARCGFAFGLCSFEVRPFLKRTQNKLDPSCKLPLKGLQLAVSLFSYLDPFVKIKRGFAKDPKKAWER